MRRWIGYSSELAPSQETHENTAEQSEPVQHKGLLSCVDVADDDGNDVLGTSLRRIGSAGTGNQTETSEDEDAVLVTSSKAQRQLVLGTMLRHQTVTGLCPGVGNQRRYSARYVSMCLKLAFKTKLST